MSIFRLLCAIMMAASVTAAQTKVSGTAQCPGKPGESHTIEVGDHPGHAYTIVRGACTWTKPFEIAGLKSTGDSAAEFSETDASGARDQTSRVGTMDNGDRFYLRTQGTHTMKDQKYENGEGTWTFAGGTGKLKGIKGKGTYKCKPEGDSVTCDIDGEYTLPAK